MLRIAISRAGCSGALLALASASVAMPATATTPDPAFRGAERLAIICQVRLARLGHEAVARDLCDKIKKIAEQNAPLPIEVIDFGGLARAPDGTVALLVHASVAPASSVAEGATGEMMSFTMRTVRTGPLATEPAWFGAAPRAARYATAGTALDNALRASLSEVLPWFDTAERLTPMERERG